MKPLPTVTNSAPAYIAISERLDEARQAVAAVEVEHDALAYQVAIGAPSAEANLEAWHQRRLSALALVGDLEAALRGAIEADQAREKKRAIEQRHQVIADVKHDLTEQLRAITKLAAAIENLNDAWSGMIELGAEIHRKLDHAGLPPSDLFPWCALIRPDRLRQLVSIELWRTNKTKQSNEGTFRHGIFGVQEAERHRGQLAVEGYGDLADGVPAHAVPLRTRLMEHRDALLKIIEAQPVPEREIVVEAARPRLQSRGATVPERTPSGLPFDRDVLPPPVPMSVVLPEDEREAELVARLETAAKAFQRKARADLSVSEPQLMKGIAPQPGENAA